MIATVYRYRLTEPVTTPAGEGHASIAGRGRDPIGRALTGAPARRRAARQRQERSGSQATQRIVTRSDKEQKRTLRGSRKTTTPPCAEAGEWLEADSGGWCDADVEGDGFG
jgi:hypothetical protein